MTMTDFDHDLKVALAAVRKAARATRLVQDGQLGQGTLVKDDRSPVTVADFAAQALVAQTLAEHCPDDPLVGEEDARELRSGEHAGLCDLVVDVAAHALGRDTVDPGQLLDWIDRGAAAGDSERYWVLDPIDGTKGFLRGGQYAIALGLVEQGRVVAGVLGCPSYTPDGAAAEGLLLFARRGVGAFELPMAEERLAKAQPIRVTATQDPAAWRFCESVESGHSDQGRSAAVAAAMGMAGEAVRMDSQAKYAAVARGDAEIYMRLPTRPGYREKVWDHAAGMIVVEEAGGVVTDVSGAPLDFTRGRRLEENRGVLASHGLAHERLVEAVAGTLADQS